MPDDALPQFPQISTDQIDVEKIAAEPELSLKERLALTDRLREELSHRQTVEWLEAEDSV